ncbi:MAG: hypothetical protein WCE21_00835 [Candidatus Babeliales bacterium]
MNSIVSTVLFCLLTHSLCIEGAQQKANEIELTEFSDRSNLSERQLLALLVSLPLDIQKIIVSYVRYETKEEFRKKLEKLCLPTVEYATRAYSNTIKWQQQSISSLQMPSFSCRAYLHYNVCHLLYHKNWYGLPLTFYDHQFTREAPQNRWEKLNVWLGIDAGIGAWMAGMGLSPNGSSLAFHVQEKKIKKKRVTNAVIGITCLTPGKRTTSIIPVDRTLAKTVFTAQNSGEGDGDIVEQAPNYLMGVSNVGKKVAVASYKKITVFSASKFHETYTIEDEQVSGDLMGIKDVCTPYLYFNQTNTMLAHLVLDEKTKSRNITMYPLPHKEELLTIPEYFARIGVCKDVMAQVKDWKL